MTTDRRQIFAFSGMLASESDRRTNFDLTGHALSLCDSVRRPRVCYVPTAVGDCEAHIQARTTAFAENRPDVDLSVLRLFSQPNVPDVRAHLLSQDMLLVEGGSVVNLMAVWRAHGLREILRECWDAGVVLSGASAGSLCWHLGGPTDSFGDSLDSFTDGLGFLPYSNGVHDDFVDQPRRRVYRELVAHGSLAAGYATEDGVGLHYVGTELHEAVSIRAGAQAWAVRRTPEDDFAEEPINPRLI